MHIIHESDRESNGRLQTYILEMGNFAVEILEDFRPLCQNLSASSYIAVVRGIESTAESERRSGPGERRGRGDCREGEVEPHSGECCRVSRGRVTVSR